MARLATIQRVSAVFRYLLIAASGVVLCALILALLTPGQDWVSVGDGTFAELWHSGASSHLTLSAVMAPIAVALALGVYWLQRLFGEYQAGRFFADSNMRCYVWLVWLKVFSFVYGAIWPLLLVKLATATGTTNSSVSFEVGSFVELVVLLLIVHLLKEAQQLNEENKAFI